MAGYLFGSKAAFGVSNVLTSASNAIALGSGNTIATDNAMVIGIDNTLASTAEEGLVIGDSHVVSGSNSLIVGKANSVGAGCDYNVFGGSGNTTANADYSAIFGKNNSNESSTCITWGSGNTNDADDNGDGHHAVGGKGNTATGAYYGLMIGSSNTTPDGQHGWITLGKEVALGDQCGQAQGAIQTAAEKITTDGDAMLVTHYCMRGQTTNNTSTQINNGGSTNFKLAANTTYLVVAYVSGRKAGDAGQSAAYRLEAVIKRDGSDNTTLGTTGVTKTVLNEDTGVTGYDATIVADDTNEAFAVKVTGDTGHNVNWVAHCSVNILTVA